MTINISKIATRAPKDLDKDTAKARTKEYTERIGELQNRLYAEGKQSLLIVLQGMDGSGKDGTTRGLFRYCSPAGVQVCTFKKPTEEEFAHDFLWRVHKQMPEKGYVKVFNRSHYEDVLIQWVHGWIDDKRREKRMKAINAFEDLLISDAKTTVLKLFLHISEEKQKEKLQERIDEPHKYWKHSDGDWEERKLWAKYQDAYNYVLNNSAVAWEIIPCDNEWYRDYLSAKIVCETLEKMNPEYPPLQTTVFK